MNHDDDEPPQAPDGWSDERPEPDHQEGSGSAAWPGRGPGVEGHGAGDSRGDGQAATLNGEIVDPSVGLREATHELLAMARSGPLPEVTEFRGYESVLPGSADRILKMAEISAEAGANATNANAEATRAVAASVHEEGRAVN